MSQYLVHTINPTGHEHSYNTNEKYLEHIVCENVGTNFELMAINDGTGAILAFVEGHQGLINRQAMMRYDVKASGTIMLLPKEAADILEP